ncbi:G1/S-specific cyclin-E [Centruroides vittatus]|uniref:G1/S-specific cyclin-E n=1 Tax=Centruroides vittatus TaxID=120091 RepID=UPI00350F4628
MSNKIGPNGKSSRISEGKPHPTILRRKRKAVVSPAKETKLKRISENGNNNKESCSIIYEEINKEENNSGNKTPVDLVSFSNFRSLTCLFTPESSHSSQSPLPYFNWANSQDVWDVLVKKDITYTRNHNMLSQHPALNSRMRAILLDWLIEVCDSYRLHRETLYLSQDFVDRYLNVQEDIPKEQLQLVGVTALFIASKIEEIYPPKISDFADITDGSCREDEILDKEMVILKALNWDLMPITVNNWLNIYLQLATIKEGNNDKENFLLPDFSSHQFLKLSQLIDLCMLDIDCLQFSYRTLAASAVYLMMSERIATAVSGLRKSDIAACIDWMLPFALTVQECGESYINLPNVDLQEHKYNIQHHNVNLELLDKAKLRQSEILTQKPAEISANELTPPSSDKKKGRSNAY